MADFDDWEMLQPDAEELEEIGEGGVAADAKGLMTLRFDYFSVESRTGGSSELSIEGGSVESDNSHSWIDPAESEAVAFCRRDDFGELWPESGSDRSRKISDCEEKNVGQRRERSGDDDDHAFGMEDQRGCLGKFEYQSGGETSEVLDAECVNEVQKTSVVSNDSLEKMDIVGMNEKEMRVKGEERSIVEVEGAGEIGKEVEHSNEVDKKVVIWWKVPLELVIKFCVFRVSPLWSISVAAAMVGVFIMRRRRLQNIKRTSKSLQIKVTVDHKKVEQFMSRAARLNEAFSVVKRVPIIRPSLPVPGVTPWPVISMW